MAQSSGEFKKREKKGFLIKIIIHEKEEKYLQMKEGLLMLLLHNDIRQERNYEEDLIILIFSQEKYIISSR